ncbi:MAG TPA: mechanosensitive ion channel family protein, partial [Bdellovibrionota bacterium]|nr:mechanosensitive ion channel family protein [Bdellovibrionota bacterium]
IWAHEIRVFALSVVALTVAGVVATKEFLLCVVGGIYKASARPFQVADRIEILKFRGDVIDHNLFTTTLFEVGPEHTVHQYTGRTIVLPNSVFLTNPLFNETYNRRFVLHTFTVPFKRTDDWRLAEKLLLESAFQEVGPYLAEAKQYMSHLERTQGLDAPVMDPRANIHFPDPERIDLVMRVPVPAQRKGRMEQLILRGFVERWERKKAP